MLTPEERERRQAARLAEIALKAQQKVDRERLKAEEAASATAGREAKRQAKLDVEAEKKRLRTEAKAERERSMVEVAAEKKRLKIEVKAEREMSAIKAKAERKQAKAQEKLTKSTLTMEKFQEKMALHAKFLDDLAIGEKAIFRNTRFIKWDFSGMSLRGIRLINAEMIDCKFDKTDMFDIHAKRSTITGCTITDCDLRSFFVKNSDLRNNKFIETDISYGDMEKCNLKGSVFYKVNFMGYTFAQCHLYRDTEIVFPINLDPSNVFEYDGKG